ncbi:MAG: DsbA family protein [Bacilli bacterium]
MFRVPNFEIIEFTDPVCTWCWGSEPVLKKLEHRFPKALKVSFVMGGLIEDIRNFRDDKNDIGGDIINTNKNIAKHWVEASLRHRMPVCVEGFKLFSNDYYSSYPANIAYHAAKIQSEKLANKYLRRLREAAATEASQITNKKVLIELASSVGLKVGAFIQAMEDGTAERLFQEDLLFTRTNRVFGFPSFLIRNNYNGKSIILRGYQDYEDIKDVMEYISDEDLVEVIKEKTPENIIGYLKESIKTTPVELQAIFDLTDEELELNLRELKAKGYITLDEVGTGNFIYYLGKTLTCDPKTGVCEY